MARAPWLDTLAVLYPRYDGVDLPEFFEWMDDNCPGWACHNSPSTYYHWHGSHEAQQAYYRETMIARKDSGGHFRIVDEIHLVLCKLRWNSFQAIPWYGGSL